MVKTYDPTTRQLIEMGPADWLEYLEIAVRDPARVRVIVREMSTMSLGIRGIEASWLYPGYFQKGKVERLLDRAREDLPRLGPKELGQPGESTLAEIAQLNDPDRRSSLLERTLEVSTWDGLLAPVQT